MGSSTPGLTEDGRTEAREAAVRLLEATLSLMDAPPMALDERQERQADCFAAELLMPASLLSAEKSGMTALCRRYRVSRQAMTFRLRSLGLTASR